MKILVTGSRGFVGRNLIENLKNIKDGKDWTRPNLSISAIYEYDADTDISLLDQYCQDCDFIFNLAGVNRPKDNSEFMDGNYSFIAKLIEALKRNCNTCPIMLSSSVQASLTGRFANSEYGRSKLAGEELFFQYAEASGAKVFVYRLPNLFGKWCRPNYNSAVATFCDAIANGREYTVNDRSVELELLYIDDLITELIEALEGKEHHCEYEGLKTVPTSSGRYCYVPITYHVTLGEVVDMLESFRTFPETLMIPEMPTDSFAKRLYSMYLSYLPKSKVSFDFQSNVDKRGSFTELFRTTNCGQISVNISRPGITKGEHWHNSKWEIFVVVSGHGLIQERKIGMNPETGKKYPVIEFEVRGDKLRAVQLLPGYTHNIINLSDSEELVTIMWANEPFDKNNPDTFFEKTSLQLGMLAKEISGS